MVLQAASCWRSQPPPHLQRARCGGRGAQGARVPWRTPHTCATPDLDTDTSCRRKSHAARAHAPRTRDRERAVRGVEHGTRCSYSTEVEVVAPQEEGERRGRARDCSLRRPCPDRDRRGGAPAHHGTARTGTAHRHRHQRTPRPSPLHRHPSSHRVCLRGQSA